MIKMANMSSLLKFLKKSEEYGSGAASDIARVFSKASKGGSGAGQSAKLSRDSAKLIDSIKSGKMKDPAMFGPSKPGMGSKAYDEIIKGYEKNPRAAQALLGGAGAAGIGGAYAMSDDDKTKKRRRAYED
jgi:hypothetical protein